MKGGDEEKYFVAHKKIKKIVRFTEGMYNLQVVHSIPRAAQLCSAWNG